MRAGEFFGCADLVCVVAHRAADEVSKSGTLRDETLRELRDRYDETTADKVGMRTPPLG
jgi:hypothetical protein